MGGSTRLTNNSTTAKGQRNLSCLEAKLLNTVYTLVEAVHKLISLIDELKKLATQSLVVQRAREPTNFVQSKL